MLDFYCRINHYLKMIALTQGHFLKNVWFKGKWGDEYLYAILEEEWQSKYDTSPYTKRET
jgi:hypothetical protein